MARKSGTSRAEYSDLMILLARTTPAAEVEKKTDGLSVFLVDMAAARSDGMSISSIDTMMNHSSTDSVF